MNLKKSDYLIMISRVTFAEEKAKYSKNIINCFDKYKGNDVFKVSSHGQVSKLRRVSL